MFAGLCLALGDISFCKLHDIVWRSLPLILIMFDLKWQCSLSLRPTSFGEPGRRRLEIVPDTSITSGSLTPTEGPRE